METLAALLASFDVTPLFPVIEGLARATAKFLSPVLLVVAIMTRLMETQVDALVTGGKYGTAVRDIMIWSFVLGAYFMIGDLIIGFFNPIYHWLDQFGSLGTVMDAFQKITDKQFAQNSALAKDRDLVDSAFDILKSPYLLVSAMFYYGTLIMLAFLTAFLKIANVLVFGVAFIWGLIAIPVSISTTFKILRGWAYLLAFSLVWPVMQGLLLGMMAMLFTNSVDTLQTVPDLSPIVLRSNTMMLFAVLHLLMGAVMVAAPFIANALVTNTSSAAGIVMPFVGAAIAAGAGAAKGLSAARTSGGSAASSLMQKITGNNSTSTINRVPISRNAKTGSASTVPAGAGFKASLGGDTGGGDAPPVPQPLSATADNPQQKAAQRRRGVLIRQQKPKKPG
jgi:hypothetical protein